MGRTNLGLFQHLLNRIEGILEGWKLKQLTLASRIIFAKSVLTTTPIYSMQSTLLHVALCNNIDQKVRDFIWGRSQEKKKVHLPRWEIVTNAKENGGLCIRSMRNINIAFMAKLGWGLITKTKDLWASVLQGKYVKGKVEIQKLMRKQISLNAWQGIVIGADVIQKGKRSRILNGKNTLFWRDIWVGDLPLIDLAIKDLVSRLYPRLGEEWGHSTRL